MAPINPTQLKPAELTRLLNSAGFGVVIIERTLRRDRNRAGYHHRGHQDGGPVRYAAWLTAVLDPERTHL